MPRHARIQIPRDQGMDGRVKPGHDDGVGCFGRRRRHAPALTVQSGNALPPHSPSWPPAFRGRKRTPALRVMAGLDPAIHSMTRPLLLSLGAERHGGEVPGVLGVGLVAGAVDQRRLADDPLQPVDLQHEAELVGEPLATVSAIRAKGVSWGEDIGAGPKASSVTRSEDQRLLNVGDELWKLRNVGVGLRGRLQQWAKPRIKRIPHVVFNRSHFEEILNSNTLGRGNAQTDS